MALSISNRFGERSEENGGENLEGSRRLEHLPKPQEFSSGEITNFDGVIIDVRKSTEYGAAHIPNAINIGLGGQFAAWAGTMIPIGISLAIAAETAAQVDESFMRLARVGHESVKGFIVMKDFAGATKTVEQISVEEVSQLPQTEKCLQFVDVRRAAEHAAGHAMRTLNIPLDKLSKELDKLDSHAPTYVICQSGYRSSLGAGILENAGFAKIYNVSGGTQACQ